jgi:hypothetical protein
MKIFKASMAILKDICSSVTQQGYGGGQVYGLLIKVVIL